MGNGFWEVQEPVMKRLRYPEYTHEHFDDCIMLQMILRERGFDVNLRDIRDAWEEYSGSMCAQWTMLPDDPGEAVQILLQYLEEVSDEEL